MKLRSQPAFKWDRPAEANPLETLGRKLARMFIIALPIIFAVYVYFTTNKSLRLQMYKYSIVDRQTGSAVISSSGYLLSRDGGVTGFPESGILVRSLVISDCSQVVPRQSDTQTPSAIAYLRSILGFGKNEPVNMKQGILLLPFSHLENSSCTWRDMLESIPSADYSAIIIPLRYEKTAKKIQSVWRGNLMKKLDMLLVKPSDGVNLVNFMKNSNQWFAWGNSVSPVHVQILLQRETGDLPGIMERAKMVLKIKNKNHFEEPQQSTI